MENSLLKSEKEEMNQRILQQSQSTAGENRARPGVATSDRSSPLGPGGAGVAAGCHEVYVEWFL